MNASVDQTPLVVIDGAQVFVCPACDTLNRRPEDLTNRYCGNCHWWTGQPQLAWARPDLFLAHGKEPLPDPY